MLSFGVRQLAAALQTARYYPACPTFVASLTSIRRPVEASLVTRHCLKAYEAGAEALPLGEEIWPGPAMKLVPFQLTPDNMGEPDGVLTPYAGRGTPSLIKLKRH